MNWKEHKLQSGREYWSDLITQTNGNVREMARRADVNRTTLYEMLRRFGLIPSLRAVRPLHRGNAEWQALQ